MDVEGEAQPFESIQQHTKKDVFELEPRILHNPQLRLKYMSLLNDLCYLAHQADEFNAEKARQGKPDLIASSCVGSPKGKASEDGAGSSSQSPKAPPPEHQLNQGKSSAVAGKKKFLKRTKRSEGSFISAGKPLSPPNILVYSESSAIRDNALVALKSVLKPDTYVLHSPFSILEYPLILTFDRILLFQLHRLSTDSHRCQESCVAGQHPPPGRLRSTEPGDRIAPSRVLPQSIGQHALPVQRLVARPAAELSHC